MIMNYELTDETIEYAGVTLHRIRALVDMPIHNVKAGELGGFVEKIENLQENAWVFDDARVFGNARVFDDARVFGNARVFDNAWVTGDAWVFDDTEVSGYAWVSE
jgi:hypothetical protein